MREIDVNINPEDDFVIVDTDLPELIKKASSGGEVDSGVIYQNEIGQKTLGKLHIEDHYFKASEESEEVSIEVNVPEPY